MRGSEDSVKAEIKKQIANPAKRIATLAMGAYALFKVFKLLAGAFNLGEIQALFTGSSALAGKLMILAAANPIFLPAIILIAIAAIFISISLSPYLKRIESADKSRQNIAIYYATFNKEKMIPAIIKHWAQQLLNLGNRILLVMSGTGLATIAATGVLFFTGLPIFSSANIVLLTAISIAAVSGLIFRILTIVLNLNLLKTSAPILLKPGQRFFQSFIKGFLASAAIVLVLQVPGTVPLYMIAAVIGIFASSYLFIARRAENSMVDKRLQGLGIIASVPAFIIFMVFISLAPSGWLVGFISSLLFSFSGITTIIANTALAKKNKVIHAISFDVRQGMDKALEFLFRQTLFNPIAVGQAFTGLAGLQLSLMLGLKFYGIIGVGASLVSGCLGLTAIIGLGALGYSVYSVISKSRIEKEFKSAVENIRTRDAQTANNIESIINDACPVKPAQNPLNALRASLKAHEGPGTIIFEQVLNFIESSPRAPTSIDGKYSEQDVRYIIREAILQLKKERPELFVSTIEEPVQLRPDTLWHRDEVSPTLASNAAFTDNGVEAMLSGFFQKSGLTATLSDRVRHFLKTPEKLLELVSLTTGLSMALPVAAGMAHVQKQDINTAQRAFEGKTKGRIPQGPLMGLGAAVESARTSISTPGRRTKGVSIQEQAISAPARQEPQVTAMLPAVRQEEPVQLRELPSATHGVSPNQVRTSDKPAGLPPPPPPEQRAVTIAPVVSSERKEEPVSQQAIEASIIPAA
ncbi:MAG: hypothetical protein AAB267_05810, partial [Candidatus Desantisbacteria bacterium]